MNLQTLLNQYELTLDKYKKLNNEYVEYLNSTSSFDDMITVDNHEYNGKILGGSETAVTNATTCKANCASFSGCTGATFKKNYCMLYSGEGTLKPSTSATAIIKKKRYYLLQLDDLNNQLLAQLQQIQRYYDTNQDKMTNELAEKKYAINSYTDNLMLLNNQKSQISSELQNVGFLESQIDSSEAEMDHQKAKFRFVAFLLFAVIIFLIYTAFFGGSSVAIANTAAAPAQPNMKT